MSLFTIVPAALERSWSVSTLGLSLAPSIRRAGESKRTFESPISVITLRVEFCDRMVQDFNDNAGIYSDDELDKFHAVASLAWSRFEASLSGLVKEYNAEIMAAAKANKSDDAEILGRTVLKKTNYTPPPIPEFSTPYRSPSVCSNNTSRTTRSRRPPGLMTWFAAASLPPQQRRPTHHDSPLI